MNADIFSELRWRGLIHQATDDAQMSRWLQDKRRTVYVGFDPTADSLHVGQSAAPDAACGGFSGPATGRSRWWAARPA